MATVPKIKRGLEKWVNDNRCAASSLFKIFISYSFLVFLALEGKPDIMLRKNTNTASFFILNSCEKKLINCFGKYFVKL